MELELEWERERASESATEYAWKNGNMEKCQFVNQLAEMQKISFTEAHRQRQLLRLSA